MSEENKIDETNIFEDFVSDESLWKEISTIDKQQEKDLYYYLRISSTFLKVFNILFFICIILFYSYSYIQKWEELKEYNVLQPICNMFLWEPSLELNTCFWVSSFLEDEKIKLQNLKQEQQKEIYKILPDAYTVENFINSESIIFLLTKTEEKIDYIKILSEFDKLKNKFASLDKSTIKCSKISITSQQEIEMECKIYSSYWDSEINDINNVLDRKWGTSLTRASLFVDFLDKDETFILIDKPKSFSSKDVTWVWFYSKETTIELKMKYNQLNNLSL